MMAAGWEDSTDVTGMEGKLAINTQAMSNLVNIYKPSGIRREIPPNYVGRFREAFITEANEFTACCFDNTELPMRLEIALNTVSIGCALQESLLTGKRTEFGKNGRRIMPADGPFKAKL
jgi:myo-inositol 2-dehydrogenase/D-chiro-inositol 1-dehydrogenase